MLQTQAYLLKQEGEKFYYEDQVERNGEGYFVLKED